MSQVLDEAQLQHRDRRGIPDHRSGHARSALAHPRRDRRRRASACSTSASRRRCTSRWSRSAPASAATCKEARAEIRNLRRADDHAGRGERPAAVRRRHASVRRLARAGDLSGRALPQVVEDMKMVARANLIFGLHVHIGVEDRETAIQLMNEVRYFLPHLLALSANSPFWLGMDTGLKSYRCKVFDKFPRTNIPDTFTSWAEFESFVNLLIQHQLHRQRQEDLVGHPAASVLPDRSKFRICDMPMRVEETHRDRGADPGDHRQALQAARAQPGLPALQPRADHGEQVARRALRPRRQADRLRQARPKCRRAS